MAADDRTEGRQAGTSARGLPDWLRAGLFTDAGHDALAALQSLAQRREVASGSFLMHQGDPADTLYFVETGRFRVVIEENGAPRTVAQIEAGEPIGELAFFGGGTRSAGLQASRDSVVWALDREAYDAVVRRFPALDSAILRSVAQRLAAVTAKTPKLEPRPPRVIALVPAGGSHIPSGFVQQLAEAMRQVLPADRDVLTVTESDAPAGNAQHYQRWLHEREARGGYVLIDASGDREWGALACRNADGLVMVAEPGTDVALSEVEHSAFRSIDPANRTLIVLRDGPDSVISGTGAWLRDRTPHVHHHIVAGHDGDMRKLARFLTGRAIGLVLAGGGALGCAHLGIIQGLRMAGVPVDYIGGTSAGAAMGAAIAQGLSVAETLDQVEAMFIHARAMRRLTIPIHSLLDPRVFDEELRARYSQGDIADQPIGFFAISTNLSTNNLHVHRRGPLWEAVRASGSLPTILPPFIDRAGNILVDGGVLDNVPVLTMRSIKAGPNIVVTLGDASQAWRIRSAYESLRGRGRLLSDVLLRRKPNTDFPSIVEIMQRSMVVASRIASRSLLEGKDILLSPPIIPGMQILDWHLGREQAGRAEDYVLQQISENPELQCLVVK